MLPTAISSSTPEYDAAIAELKQMAIAQLAKAVGRQDLLRDAILSYLREGYQIGATDGELVDFFCVDTPNIVESAGYRDSAADAVVHLFFEVYEQLQREKKPDRLHNDSPHYLKCHDRWQMRGNRLPLQLDPSKYPSEWYAQQCGGCKYFVRLTGAFFADWGCCTNEQSPLDGRAVLEHDGCDSFSAVAEGWDYDQIFPPEPESGANR